jgi:hypothetical protein
MRYPRMSLVALGLLLLSGAVNGAPADNASTTLYTSAIRGTGFHCNAVNVSRKTLLITISIITDDGSALAAGAATPTLPGMVASNDVEPLMHPADGYCQVQVSGTGDRNDLRVAMKINLIRTFDEGSQTDIPVFLSWTLVGY